MSDYLSACNIFPALLLYKLSLSLFRLSSTITLRPFITNKTMAVHSFVTRDAIKWNSRNVRIQLVFAQPVTYSKGSLLTEFLYLYTQDNW